MRGFSSERTSVRYVEAWQRSYVDSQSSDYSIGTFVIRCRVVSKENK